MDVINNTSQYIKMINWDSDWSAQGAGSDASLNTDYKIDSGAYTAHRTVHKFNGGSDGNLLGTDDLIRGWDLFEDKDQVEVDFLIAPDAATRLAKTTVVNDLVATAQSTRKDCVVVTSPARSDVVGVTSDADKVTNAVATGNTFTKSSYLVMDNNFLKVYDKYNDKYVEIPAASTVAGAMASTDINRAAWFSPAGNRRGQMLGITALNYSPTKGQRDTLYKNGINPIANIPGQGALLFGDKTFLGRVSAFDRINVRRLFLILERAIGRAAEQVLFELNDEFTRAEFVNIVEPVLREVQGRRGITDFRVVCDETNNTAEVVDRNEFKADIFIKPARSINFVTLSFVAVRTGVDFEEVVGTV
jgi:phage tail sheath protein FI